MTQLKCRISLLHRKKNSTLKWVVTRPDGKKFRRLYASFQIAVREAVDWQRKVYSEKELTSTSSERLLRSLKS